VEEALAEMYLAGVSVRRVEDITEALNEPNFTRGMSDDEKSMLRALSHTHVGAADPPSE